MSIGILLMYYSSDKFINDIFTLKNAIVFVTDVVEYEISSLDTKRYKFIKDTLNKNNIRVIVVKHKNNKRPKIM